MEDYFILKNILIQGLKAGYKKGETGGEISNPDMHNGIWRMSNGLELGSSWDIILSKDFAEIFWKGNASENLQKMVIMDSQERVNFLKDFVDEDKVGDVDKAVESGDIYETPGDALMMAIRDSLGRLKNYSIELYKESCEETYENIKETISKSSVTELDEKDFILLNATNKIMDSGLFKYLIENSKFSFTICPECGHCDFTHADGCSIEIKCVDWLINQNEGC